MTAMTGLGSDAASGGSIFDLFPDPRGTTAIEAAWRGALEGKVSETTDRVYVNPVGSGESYYDARYAPLYGENGEIVGGLALVRDTTERHRMEETMRQAQKMEAVGQLTGGIAHDFNNLLTAVIGNLQLAADAVPGDSLALRRIRAAERAADRGARLTSQLLAFARRKPLRPEICNLNELVRDFHNLTQRAAGDSVEIVLRLDPELWPCRIDPPQFEAAMLNLVVNARDAMANGGVITIETANATLASVTRKAPRPATMCASASSIRGSV